jgi:hypothetical protein
MRMMKLPYMNLYSTTRRLRILLLLPLLALFAAPVVAELKVGYVNASSSHRGGATRRGGSKKA